MKPLRYPFLPFNYAVEMDNDARTVTVHRADKRCYPPRRNILGRIAQWFGGRNEQTSWTLASSIEDARVNVDNLNETVGKAFHGLLSPYRFKVCPCTAGER